MKFIKITIFALICNLCFSQQYDSVKLETKNIDTDNLIYKTGNVYIFDYEIIEKEKSFKLKTNNSEKFELVDFNDTTILIKNIHLIIEPQIDSLRTNENQTEIIYFQLPQFSSFSSTGLVDNKDNIWMHPIREGFFHCLETCPFPFIKFPLTNNKTWTDKMLIGEQWGNIKWGKWKDNLLLNYEYKIVGKKKINTLFGKIKCYIIESTAESTIGKTKLVSYFSEQYGFIRFEYSLLNNIKVNIWLIEFMKDKIFNDEKDFFKTRKYLKE